MQTVRCKVVIPTNRQLRILIPEEVPPGPAEIVLVIAPEAPPARGLTAGDLLRSPLCGLWKERADIGDGPEYTRLLRARAEQHTRA
jgi:hypothetical protein